ncbi:hypothetical protein CBR_g41724 [Chara braunii]|uniref:RING-type E3 ubiquitin transferase n=1 Tax=Chara braunii TaxID=69332 RepID=A0A388LWS0_CHABU|nr:hypothetical protein CBR_g41724 [Chara braunii]|eukprot:GBG86662.1 hypothetical protein CBR_g41724 [Chara braunii]
MLGVMEATVGMLGSLANLVELLITMSRKSKTHKNNCQALVKRIKVLSPLLEEIRLSGQPLSNQALACMEDLMEALQKAKALLEHCNKSSRLYLAFKGHYVVMKFQDVSLELDRCIQRIPLVLLRLSEHIRLQIYEVSKMLRQTKYTVDNMDEQISAEIASLLREQRKGLHINNALMNQIAVQLGITSTSSIQDEAQALELAREEARKDKDKLEEQYINQIISLLFDIKPTENCASPSLSEKTPNQADFGEAPFRYSPIGSDGMTVPDTPSSPADQFILQEQPSLRRKTLWSRLQIANKSTKKGKNKCPH